jgi:hypothetical protein
MVFISYSGEGMDPLVPVSIFAGVDNYFKRCHFLVVLICKIPIFRKQNFSLYKYCYETSLLLHNTQGYDHSFQQHGVPYYY